MTAYRGGAPIRRNPLTLAALFVVVMAVIIVSQVAALAYLGYVAGGSTPTSSCAFSFWIFQIGCSTGSTASPSAQNAQALATFLGPVFAIMDVLIFVVLAFVAIRDRGVSSRSGASRSLRAR